MKSRDVVENVYMRNIKGNFTLLNDITRYTRTQGLIEYEGSEIE